MSIDGYIDNSAVDRLVLSNDQDLDRVDALRASCDAILVGAGTIRSDNPRLIVRSPARRAARRARGLAEYPAKVVISKSGQLNPESRFLALDAGEKFVYVGESAVIDQAWSGRANVVRLREPIPLASVLADLAHRGISRLLVEGGSSVHTQFLEQNLADELQLAIAPIFIGDPAAPRFVNPGIFPGNSGHRARLVTTASIGDCALLRYGLSDRCAADSADPPAEVLPADPSLAAD